jgi:allophanate hydrolase
MIVLADLSLDFSRLQAAYASGLRAPHLVAELLRRIEETNDPAIWIARFSDTALMAAAEALEQRRAAGDVMPLFGFPFAVKDNIDVAGLPTTAACPAYAYTPAVSAPVVQRLLAAGALCIGKTNLDQFATGLVGVRSPYGTPRNAIDARYVPGGSSSGSAVAVALGQVAFALGTDTAGSGRVPAGFNNIVGLKPTRGALSTSGVVPACRSLDCVSVFALTAPDAMAVFEAARGSDETDPYSRAAPAGFDIRPPSVTPRIGVPKAGQLDFFGDAAYAQCWLQAVERLQGLGVAAVEIDITPFLEAANLLYGGPWVAERAAAVGDFIASNPAAAWPVTRTIIEGGTRPTAVETFRAMYRLEALRTEAAKVWKQVDALLLPTTGTIYTLEQLAAEPVRFNTNLGAYTNFMNLLDLCGVAVPAGFTPAGLPFGITLAAPAWHENMLAPLADRLHRAAGVALGATKAAHPPATSAAAAPWPDVIIAVCGAHMKGLPLNRELLALDGRFLEATRTAAGYRLYRLPGGPPVRPGLVRSAGGGAIALELWSLPSAGFGAFVARIPAPLGIGTITLEDGRTVKGFLCEAAATEGAEDITALGGWRAYLETLRASPPPRT